MAGISSKGQNSPEAKKLLDEVSDVMTSYKNLKIDFKSSLENVDAGITNDSQTGNIILEADKYHLNYVRNSFIFDGSKLYVINHDEKEISINEGDMEEGDGFIYPSKLFTFYKEGYNYEMAKIKSIDGKKVQYIYLSPIDSNSEIVKVELGIDLATKNIFQLIQTGSNGAKTTFTIDKLESNLKLPTSTFTLDQKKYEKLNYLID